MSELWENREERDAAVAKRRRVDGNRQTYWTALAAVTVAWIVTSFGAAATVEADRRADVFASMRSLGLWFGIGTIAVVVSVAAARALNERLAEFFEKHLVDRRSMAAHRVLVGAELILLGGSSGHLVVQFWQIPGASALETGVIVGLIVLVLSSTLYFAAGPAEHRLEITAALTAETAELRRRAQHTGRDTAHRSAVRHRGSTPGGARGVTLPRARGRGWSVRNDCAAVARLVGAAALPAQADTEGSWFGDANRVGRHPAPSMTRRTVESQTSTRCVREVVPAPGGD